jgi:hypothetical protein
MMPFAWPVGQSRIRAVLGINTVWTAGEFAAAARIIF